MIFLRQNVRNEKRQDVSRSPEGARGCPSPAPSVIGSWPGRPRTRKVKTLKNDKFEEEREYRLVKITHTLPAEICTRPSTQGLIPYVPFKLDASIIDNPQYNPTNFGIERIVIGPALHHEHQRAAVRALFTSHGMEVEEDSIEVSKVPYSSIR